ncbi:hypothetical protein Sar04_16210 [Salinispora arenicola]|uniref:Uncharacterized protein n=2 Tax=Salinispora arenicola TaxID=168697 RepID=A0ABQ4JPH8_SALAC|nr:hypothetical protein Sar04_16210 [Salinispora arenicola]
MVSRPPYPRRLADPMNVPATAQDLAALRAQIYRAVRLDQDITAPMLRLLLAGGEQAGQRVITELDRLAR